MVRPLIKHVAAKQAHQLDHDNNDDGQLHISPISCIFAALLHNEKAATCLIVRREKAPTIFRRIVELKTGNCKARAPTATQHLLKCCGLYIKILEIASCEGGVKPPHCMARFARDLSLSGSMKAWHDAQALQMIRR